MTRYSVQPRDIMLVKVYGFLSFAKNTGKNRAKNISNNLSGKCSQKLIDHAKKSETDVLVTSSKRVIQKTDQATGDLIGNKIANTITKSSQDNNSETVTNEHDKEIPKEKYASPEERQEIINKLRLKQQKNGISKKSQKCQKKSQQNSSETVTND